MGMTVGTAFLSSLMIHLPLYLVWFVGAVLSLIFWGRHPKVSIFLLIAIAVFFVISIIDMSLSTLVLPQLALEYGPRYVSPLYVVKGLAVSVLNALSWGLVLAAIFSSRRGRSTGAGQTRWPVPQI